MLQTSAFRLLCFRISQEYAGGVTRINPSKLVTVQQFTFLSTVLHVKQGEEIAEIIILICGLYPFSPNMIYFIFYVIQILLS